DVSGYVYFDFNNDGIKNPGEWGIGGVRMTLAGTDVQGHPVNLAAWTDETGLYKFDDVMPCQAGTTYLLSQQQPASMIDGKETLGDQGGSMAGNDQMRIYLPLFGYTDGILGMHNNFAELGFRAEFAGLGLWDLVHSGTGESSGGNGEFLFGTDALGNLLWYINLGGWHGYVPGQQSPTNPDAFALTTHNGKLPLTDMRAAVVREINAADEAIRSMYSRSGGWVTRITGEADDFGLPMYQSAAVAEGEGEGISETSDAELLAADGSYEAAVDAVLAEVA
ncbi:MAG TPA: SdrD B-like domain-containing protein, partial [Candidatus Anammoximicrobium sp.]|nr:SdrD B-like domain-containing protein [Candidatus Anammoximicrobium sp.]